MDQARRPDVIVAYEMLGAPVTRDHGGPVRLYVAPMYGYKSLKWLDGIQVTDHVDPGLLGRQRLRRRRVDRKVKWQGRQAGLLIKSKAAHRRAPSRLARFDLGERILHWLNAILMLTLLATGSALYIPPISQLVGQRQLVLAIHVYAGIAIPFPLLLTAAAAGGARRSAPMPAGSTAGAPTTIGGCAAGARPAYPKRQVQCRPEAQRRLYGRHHRGDAGHRLDHAVPQRVAAVVADRRHLCPRLALPGCCDRRRRPHSLRHQRLRLAAEHVERLGPGQLGPPPRPRWYEEQTGLPAKPPRRNRAAR